MEPYAPKKAIKDDALSSLLYKGAYGYLILEFPHLCVTKDRFGRIVVCTGDKTNLSSIECCIVHVGKVLQIDVQIETCPFGHHRDQIGLIVPELDSLAGATRDRPEEIVVFVRIQLVAAVGIDEQVIQRAAATNTKGNPGLIALENPHLGLKYKIGDRVGVVVTVVELPCL